MKAILSSFVDSMNAQLISGGMSFRKFITEETYINGNKFSFVNHEYQDYCLEVIENSPGCTVNISKCSQIGISEIVNRAVLAIMAVVPNTAFIVSFPSKSFSQEVFKTRFSPVIEDSPALRGLINREVDSASVKAFHNGSIAYALGGNNASKGTLLNRAISGIVNDELDRADPDIVTGYRSRMTHTPPEKRLIINISTPTVAGCGIDAEINESRFVHTPWIKCPCGHEFIGDYYTHVKIPGFNESLKFLTKAKAVSLPIEESYLECPECKCAITAENKTTVWKIEENELGVKKKIGIVLDPFVAMSFISIPDLVESSLIYSSLVEFLNQGLGKVADIKDSTIDVTSLHFQHEAPMGMHIFGLDLGKLNYFIHGILKYDTTIHIVEAKIIPLPELEEYIRLQFLQYPYAAGVMDAQPYTDLVYRVIKKHPRLYSAIYTDPVTPRPDVFTLTDTDKFGELVRQLAINKPLAMNNLAANLPDFYTFEPGEHDDLIKSHYKDMRKVRDYRFEEIRYTWIKSKQGVDHFWHSTLYLSMAAKLAQANIQHFGAMPIKIMKMNVERRRAELERR